MRNPHNSLRVAIATMDDATYLVANDSDEHVSAKRVREKIARSEYVVARRGDVYAGYVRLSHFWSFIPFFDIIGVEDEYRLQGIGRAMLGLVEARAREQKCSMMLSSSQADEPGAQTWHRKVGFRDAGAFIDLGPLQDLAEILFIKSINCE